MISDEQLRSIALFYLFTFLDEKTSLHAAESASAQIKARPLPQGPLVDETGRRVEFIKVLKKIFDQNRKTLPRNRQTGSLNSAPGPGLNSWKWPEGIEMRAWTKFQRDSSDGEVMSVVLSKILGYTDYEIADGLHISIGTARYRIGKGMRQLGSALRARS